MIRVDREYGIRPGRRRNCVSAGRRGRSIIFVLGVVALVLACGGVMAAMRIAGRPPLQVVFEATPQPVTASVYLAEMRGYFAAEGLQVRVNDHPTGRQALAALIGNAADYVVCADTPFVRAFGAGAPLAVLAQIGDVAHYIHLFGLRERGIDGRFASLAGRRVGLVQGTNAEYVIYSVGMLRGFRSDHFTAVHLGVDELEPALAAGTVDAICTWDPLAERTRHRFGERVAEIGLDDFHRTMWLLCARNADRDPARDEAVVRAVSRAAAELARDPAPWSGPLARRLGFTSDELGLGFTQSRFRLTMDQSLLLNLEAQRRWIGLGGPEMFTGLSPLPLLRCDPAAVTLVHPEVVR